MLRRFCLWTGLSFVLMCGSFLNGSVPEGDTISLIDKQIEIIKDEIIKIRRFIHMNPELGNREYETAKLLASRLLSLGIDVETGVAKTGVIGTLHGGQPGPTVAVRADMDALPIQEETQVPYKSLNPGIMHACGHDIHAAVVLGTAYVLSAIKERIRGNVKFIFQPAEEGSPPGEEGGARLMIKEGVLDDPPVMAIFGFHVWPENLGEARYSPGAIMASSDSFRVLIKGKSAHGARPHEGIDAIVLASQVILSIQAMVTRTLDATDPAVVSIGTISGGKKANIIADEVRFEGTIRTLSEINRNKIRHSIQDILRGMAQAYGAEYTYEYAEGPPSLYNHPELSDIMVPTLKKILGEDNVHALNPQMVAEDFSFFCEKIPGFYFFLGAKNPEQPAMPPLHSPTFNPDERSIPLGIRIMCHLLLDCLDHQSQEKQEER